MAGYFIPSRAWDNTTPDGAQIIVAQLDDHIRYVKVDVQERLDSGHHFRIAGSNVWEYVGAHRRGFVQWLYVHATQVAMKDWCYANYGGADTHWARYAGVVHLVIEDGTGAKNGMYRMHASGYLRKFADLTASDINVTP